MVSRCQRSLPSARPKQSRDRRYADAGPPGRGGGQSFFSEAWVTNTRSPQTTGVEFPSSGRFTFQRTFSVLLQWRGKPFSGECPCPSGPRQAGQSAAATGIVVANNK